MPLNFTCPTCGKKLKAPDDAAGKEFRCPGCLTILTAPEEILEAEMVEPPDHEPETYDVAGGGAAASGGAESERDPARRPCPYCGEMILQTAAKCRYCGEIFDPELRALEEKRQKRADPGASQLSAGDWVLAVLCSGIGCIVGIVWMIQGKPKGLKMFGVSILFGVLWNIITAAIQSAGQH